MKEINIKNLGAVSSLEINQTKVIQKAIDECFLNGGGTVIIPEGEYLIGDIRLRSNVTLYLKENAKIFGSNNPEDYFNHLNDKIEPLSKEQITDAPYVHLATIHGETEYIENNSNYRFRRIPASRWNNAIIRAIDAENITIIAEKNSFIDGVNCYDSDGEEEYRGPHGITFFNCKNIKLSGYTLKNIGNWGHNLLYCENILIDNITVLAGHDGFDAFACKNIEINNSEFCTGDDCLAGFGNVNVHFTNCVLNSSCSAMRFGGTNVVVEKCNIYGPGKYCFRGSLSMEERSKSVPSKGANGRNNMLSVFTYYADYSMPIKEQPGNIIIKDCEVNCADKLLHYNYSGNEVWQKHKPLTDISFINVNAKNLSLPSVLYGDENEKVDLTLKNVNIEINEEKSNINVINASGFGSINMENVKISGLNSDAVVKTWSDGKINVENSDFGETKEISVKSNEAFFANAI